jgi:PAS domain S-box-containing protein
MAGQITPVSPVATFFIILSAVALFLVFRTPDFPDNPKAQDLTGIIGFFLVLMSFTVLLSYGFGAPFLYKTTIIPIAFTSALAAFFIGLGLITTAGSSSMPLRYLSGPTIRARLLRAFLPLIVIIVLAQGLLQATLVSVYHVDNAILVSTGLMMFCLITAYVVGKAADEVGRLLESEEEKRRKAEGLLHESEETFRALAENANDGILVAVGTGVHVFANRRAAEITGYSVDELVKLHIRDLSNPDEFTRRVQERYNKILAGEPVETQYETLIVSKDGKNVPIEVTSAKTDWKGQSADLVLIRDISARKQAEDELRESEEKYRTLFENMLEGFAYCRMIYDDHQNPVDFTYLNVNSSFDRIIGAKTVTGKLVTEVFPGIREAFPQLFEIYGRVALTGQPESFDINFRPAGKWLHVSVYSPGKEYFVAIFEDITEQRRAEEKIKISETRYRRLFESAKDGILILNRDSGEIIDANPFIETLLGYAPKDLLGKRLWEIGFFKDQLASKVAFEELQSKEYLRYEDLPLETKNGQRKEVEFVSNVYPIDHTSVIQCNIRDITDRKMIEYQREVLIRELEQKNAELERFNYTVSHDLRSPLITIHGFAGLLETDIGNRDEAAISHDLDRINTATNKMEELLQDLLNLSRIGRIVNTSEEASFTMIAREAVELLEVVIGERKARIIIDPDMPTVRVDRARVREAVMNLVENAVKFMGDQQQPEIRIGVEDDTNQPTFFVRDNGIGIDPKYFGKIFTLFEKLDVKKEGSGVGLAIVKRIIEIQGGRIWVESAGLGKGSTFRFTLPTSSRDRYT